MRAAGVFVVAPDDADVAPIDQRAEIVATLEGPGTIAEQLRFLLAFLFRLGRILRQPFAALGEAVRGERWVGLDLVVEVDAALETLALQRGVGLGLAGRGWGANSDQ